MANNANDVLNVARGELGYSRAADPQRGTKYGRWYGSIYGDVYVETAWCYMFVSWCFNQAGATAPCIPGAYCPTGVNQTKAAGRNVAARNAVAGDIVFFDWGPDGVSDHVGIVESNNGSYLTTIEGNTGGGSGYVQRRTRAYSTTCAICRPTYGGASAPVVGGGDPQKGGKRGADAIRDMQNYLKKWGYNLGAAGANGLTNADTAKALISYVQYNMNAYGEALSVDGVLNETVLNLFQNKYGPVGAGEKNSLYMVKAVQMGLEFWGLSIGPDGIDGSCGPATIAAIRELQTGHHLEVDGIAGRNTLKDMVTMR